MDDAFRSPKFKTWNEVTINDVLNKFEGRHTNAPEQHNVFCNFDKVAKSECGTQGHFGKPWFDGPIYESIRGIADYLVMYPDKELGTRISRYIDRIEAAQMTEPTGHLKTHTLLKEPKHRWGDNGSFLRWQHDVYNAGVTIEAAVHYYKAIGKTKLLEVATRYINYMVDYMGPAPKKNIVPSHFGSEEAIIKLYWLFKEQSELKEQLSVSVNEDAYWKLATFWIENRGHHCGYPLRLTWGNGKSEKWIRDVQYNAPEHGEYSRPTWGDYTQDSIPVFEQQTIEGHVVRATPLAAGITTAVLENRSPKYIETVKCLQDNTTGRRMFITGGVGTIHKDEKFGPDFFLPPGAYLETCAVIGAGFFSQKVSELTGKGMYMDELERVLYNSLLIAVSLRGDSYTYRNPLNAGKHNRWEWHGCPCCPPMFLKITSALPGSIHASDKKGVYTNPFIGNGIEIKPSSRNNVQLKQETSCPWKGEVDISVNPQKVDKFPTKVRIPGWAQGIENLYEPYQSNLKGASQLFVNGKSVPIKIVDGYVEINREWQKGDLIELGLLI